MLYNLSEITGLIKNRRTVFPEQFTDRKVQKDQIELILKNAQWAPTHGNTQPWRFVVYTEKGKEKLSEFLGQLYLEKVEKEKQNSLKLKKITQRPLLSSVVIAVCMSRQKEEKILELEEIEAVACAIQNMQLTCTAYGLGSFWSTPKLIYSKEMNTFLNLEEKDKCLGLIYIGYPAIKWPKSHRKPIHYNTKWITQ